MSIETLDAVRAFVRERSRVLDPQSRYIRELLAIVDARRVVAPVRAAV